MKLKTLLQAEQMRTLVMNLHLNTQGEKDIMLTDFLPLITADMHELATRNDEVFSDRRYVFLSE